MINSPVSDPYMPDPRLERQCVPKKFAISEIHTKRGLSFPDFFCYENLH